MAHITKAITAAIVAAVMVFLADSGGEFANPSTEEMVQSIVSGLVTGGFTWLFPNRVKKVEQDG